MINKQQPHITVGEELTREQLVAAHGQMVAATAEELGSPEVEILNVTLRDEDELLGAISASTFWSCLAIDIFWVHADHRGKGWGTALLQAAEREAIARGCRGAHFDTFSPRAARFYERNGYRVAAALTVPGSPATRYVLSKEFGSESSEAAGV